MYREHLLKEGSRYIFFIPLVPKDEIYKKTLELTAERELHKLKPQTLDIRLIIRRSA